MPDEEPLRCPDCGARMNHHATRAARAVTPDA